MANGFYLTRMAEAFIISFGLALVVAPISIKIAKRFGIIDKPKDARRVHKIPTPRFGGMAIFVGSMAAMMIPAGMNQNIKVAMVGGAMMYLLGILDDIFDLKPVVKFAGQLLTASVVYALGVRISFISNYFGLTANGPNANVILSGGVSYLITVFWIVGITNAVNLMDGLDGLAAGCVAIMSLSLAYIAYIHGARLGSMPVCIALIAVAGGCLGFLPYNFSPAKTFMGDGGALYLGYMIAILSIISPLKRATIVGALIPMLTLAVPIFDTMLAMLRRTLKHESIMTADKWHLHHHLMAAGFGQRRSVLIMYGIVGIMGEAAVLISRELYKDAFILFMIAMLYLCIIIVPKRPKKGIKRIITQDTSELEKEYFAEYLKYERERRRELREAAKAAAEEMAEAEEAEEAKEVAEEAKSEAADAEEATTENGGTPEDPGDK
jgi:UDP-GlcNAc:undecaprenyl-phosphate GlcNAc-1-phosphate transferase